MERKNSSFLACWAGLVEPSEVREHLLCSSGCASTGDMHFPGHQEGHKQHEF